MRKSRPIETDNEDSIVSMDRSQVTGSLQSNMEVLNHKLNSSTCTQSKVSHYKAIYEAGSYILENGPLVKTQEVGVVYLECKHLDKRKCSCEYYEIFSKHLNLIQIYIFGCGYLLPNTSSKVQSLIDTIKNTVNTEKILQETANPALDHLFRDEESGGLKKELNAYNIFSRHQSSIWTLIETGKC